MTLLDDSEPEPDLAIVHARDAESRDHRQAKAALYARASIPEYWIVNLDESTVEIRREPDPAGGSYRTKTVARSGETLIVAAVPGLEVAVADLFR